MTITQLETFLRIADKGSFSSAASDLGYAQSTVTMQIKQLEEELGSDLFNRLGKTISLTPAGERLVVYAEKLLQLEREIYLEVPDSAEPSGIIKLGVSESLCYNRCPRILMQYRKSYPKVDIRLSFITHDTFPELLKKGELDIVYTLNPLVEDENLALLYKQSETLGFYVCPEHKLAKKNKVRENDLKDVPLLITSHNCSFRHMLVTDLFHKGIVPSIAIETSSKEVLKQFAISGMGVAFMPDMTVVTERENRSLVRLDWAGDDFPIYSQIFIHKDKRVTGAVEGFLDLVRNLTDGEVKL